MSFFNNLRHKWWFVGGGVLLLAIIVAGGGWLVYHALFGSVLPDAALQKAFSNIPAIQSYSQYIETQTQLSGRTLKIAGIYGVDSPDKRFSAVSTTTLNVTGDPKSHIFTYQNIAIANDVYTKIQTTDPLLKKSIQNSPDWLHFMSGGIPATYADIVVPGPIQDNLQILSDNGAYLTLTKKWGSVTWGTESLLRYTFKLSGHTSSQNGTLEAILNRLAPGGMVDLWLNPTTDEPRYLRFENDPYVSTTTIEDINTLPTIVAPTVQS